MNTPVNRFIKEQLCCYLLLLTQAKQPRRVGYNVNTVERARSPPLDSPVSNELETPC
jgi:hypothetical protein